MSGWIARWSFTKPSPDDPSWGAALALIARHGEAIESLGPLAGGHASLAVWRRTTGEFPHSGRLHSPADGVRVAWVGQCLEDAGDASEPAIARIASQPGDGTGLGDLNGPFAAAVVQEEPGRLTLVLDRHRHYPVYSHRSPDSLVASTDWRALLPWVQRRALAPAAVDMLLRCGEQLEGMTLLQGVEMLPAACLLDASAMGVTRTQYWFMRHRPEPGPGRDALARSAGDALRRAVERVERAVDGLGITLSGGLDSRFLLGLCSQPGKVPSFTWGVPGCRDIACAADFARRVGSPHTVRHWEPAAFPPRWQAGVDVTAGSVSIENMYMLPFTDFLAGHCGVVLNGLAGDAILGGNFLTRAWLRETSLERLARTSWRWRVSAAEDGLVDAIAPGVDGARGESLWVASILLEEHERPIVRLNDWLYENRVFRNTNCGTMLLRRHVESHAPFFDRDVLDLLLRIPLEMRLKHRLYLPAMNRACPAAGRTPWQRTALPPAWGYHANLGSMAFHRVYGAALRRIGREPFPRLKVADPAAWMRGPWRAPIEAIILSAQCLDRGVFKPDGVRAAWQELLDGAPWTRLVGALVTVELFARLALDGSIARGEPVHS